MLVYPIWDHPLWCDHMRLFGAYICLTTQGRLFYLPNTYFKNNITPYFSACFSKSVIPLPVPWNMNAIFGCIPRLRNHF